MGGLISPHWLDGYNMKNDVMIRNTAQAMDEITDASDRLWEILDIKEPKPSIPRSNDAAVRQLYRLQAAAETLKIATQYIDTFTKTIKSLQEEISSLKKPATKSIKTKGD